MFSTANGYMSTGACMQASASSFCAFSPSVSLSDIALLAVSVFVAARISLCLLAVILLPVITGVFQHIAIHGKQPYRFVTEM